VLPKLFGFAFRVLLVSLIEFDLRIFDVLRVRSRIKSFAAFSPGTGVTTR
jgi:hypothetical protein